MQIKPIFNELQVVALLKVLNGEKQAHHNWIASAVEVGNDKYAADLVLSLRNIEQTAKVLRAAYHEATGEWPVESGKGV